MKKINEKHKSNIMLDFETQNANDNIIVGDMIIDEFINDYNSYASHIFDMWCNAYSENDIEPPISFSDYVQKCI